MVTLTPATRDDLPAFREMAKQSHAQNFVLQQPQHYYDKLFDEPNSTFLRICDAAGNLLGHFILILEEENDSVEFGRIVIDAQHQGVGQAAITAMEAYCRDTLKVQRIWLDVFEDNPRAIHVYEKLGYTRFKSELFEGRTLLFYEKSI